MTDATLRVGVLSDLVICGLRVMLGVTFIVHGFMKFNNPGFVSWMSSLGISPELAFLIAVAESSAGILLVFGLLSRISAVVLVVILLCAMIIIKELVAFTGETSYEFDLALLASALVIMIVGPARLSVAHIIRRLPRCLH